MPAFPFVRLTLELDGGAGIADRGEYGSVVSQGPRTRVAEAKGPPQSSAGPACAAIGGGGSITIVGVPSRRASDSRDWSIHIVHQVAEPRQALLLAHMRARRSCACLCDVTDAFMSEGATRARELLNDEHVRIDGHAKKLALRFRKIIFALVHASMPAKLEKARCARRHESLGSIMHDRIAVQIVNDVLAYVDAAGRENTYGHFERLLLQISSVTAVVDQHVEPWKASLQLGPPRVVSRIELFRARECVVWRAVQRIVLHEA